MTITDAVSLAIIAFFLGFALADRLNRCHASHDRRNNMGAAPAASLPKAGK